MKKNRGLRRGFYRTGFYLFDFSYNCTCLPSPWTPSFHIGLFETVPRVRKMHNFYRFRINWYSFKKLKILLKYLTWIQHIWYKSYQRTRLFNQGSVNGPWSVNPAQWTVKCIRAQWTVLGPCTSRWSLSLITYMIFNNTTKLWIQDYDLYLTDLWLTYSWSCFPLLSITLSGLSHASRPRKQFTRFQSWRLKQMIVW